MMFQNGELDLLDLDYLDSSVVDSTYKTQYADNLDYGNRLAITYMSMNQEPEHRALQRCESAQGRADGH